jgi:hypothetical protein
MEKDAGFFYSIAWVIDNTPAVVVPSQGWIVRFDLVFFVGASGPSCFADK